MAKHPEDILRDNSQPPSEPIGTERVSMGTVKWWRDAKGYGVIATEDTAPWDVWCHFSAIAGEGFRTLNQGEVVEVAYWRMNQESFKYVARSVRRITQLGASFMSAPTR
jgi:cold shock protein